MPQEVTPEPRGYRANAVSVDPVAMLRALDAQDGQRPSGGSDFSEGVRFSPQTWPDDGVRARDEFYYAESISSSESFKQKHFSVFTWAMIVIAGIVLGGSLALMAAGA